MILLRYLNREVFLTTSAVTLALLVIVTSSRFVKYLAEAASGTLAAELMAQLILFRLPDFLELILPMALFIGILLAYGRLYVESEMVVLRSGGMSEWRLLGYTLPMITLVTALVAWFSVHLGPSGVEQVEKLLKDPRNREGLSTLVSGKFRSRGYPYQPVIYTRELSADHQRLREVFLVEPRAEDSPRLSFSLAQEGQVVEQPDGRFLELHHGVRYELQPGLKDLSATEFGRLGWRMPEPDVSAAALPRIDGVGTATLLAGRDESTEYRAELAWRLSQPLIVPVVALLALAMARTNPRRGRYGKLLPAFLIYLFYLVLLSTVRSLADEGKVHAYGAMAGVHLAALLLALALTFGGDSWRRWRPRPARALTLEGQA